MPDQKNINLINCLLSFGVSDFSLKVLDEIPMEKLLEFSLLKSEPKVAFRASWALEHILLKNPTYFDALYKVLILNYQEIRNWSALRSYTKLITFIVGNKNYVVNAKQHEIIVEKTFGLLEQKECPIAVKVNCFDILYHLIEKYPWIKNELILIIQFNLEKQNSPALNSRGNYLLKRIFNS